MKHLKLTLLMIYGISLSTTVMADEDSPDVAADPLVNCKLQSGKPMTSEQYNTCYSGLMRELDLLKLKAQIAETHRQITESTTTAATGAQVRQPDPETPPVLRTREAQVRESEEAPDSSSVQHVGKRIEDLYVTRIEGFGRNLVATVYNQNHVLQVQRGEEILPGIVVDDILQTGVIFRQDGKSVRVPLTTSDIAHRNTIKRNEAENANANARRSMMPSVDPNFLPFGLQ